MAARRSNSRSGLLSVIFTTLLAPIIASVIAGLIKDDMNAPIPDGRRLTPPPVVARYTPAATLLPPVNAAPRESMRDNAASR
jgi:hypothetical protein